MAATFFLRPKALKQARQQGSAGSAAANAARAAEWRAAFPEVDPAIAAGAAALFPATSADTFKRWQKLRSSIETEAGEAILQEETDRPTILPLQDDEMWGFYKKLERLQWTADEIVLTGEAQDRKKVSSAEFNLIKKTLGWFGPADEAVMEGLDEVASAKIKRKEGQFYLRMQGCQECVHSESYSLQIQGVVPADEQEAVFRAVREDVNVARVADWIRWWVIAEHPSADFFAAMAFIEGALFSGFFAAIQFFKNKNVFPGITTLNEFIARDEGIHTLFWCFLLTKRLERRPDETVVHGIAREIVMLSSDFFVDALPEPIPGMNAELLCQYVRYVADTILVQTGCTVIFKDDNPFDFMDKLSLNEVAKSNFFEHRPTQYQKLGKDALDYSVDNSPISDL